MAIGTGAAILGSAAVSAGSSLLGGLMDTLTNDGDKQWQKNYNAQKEFAQNSIQWRVQDAQKAGLHPLYAMGNTPGYTPSSSFETNTMGQAIAQAGNAFGQAMGQIGIMNAYLQNENLQADLQSKQLANKNKELELFNKVIDAQMGQRSSTLGLSNLTGQTDNELSIASGGLTRNLPGQLESEIASLPADLAKVIDTQYNPETIRRLPVKDKHGRVKVMMLSPLGFSSKYVKDSSELGLIDRATRAYYNAYDKLEKGSKWLLNKFFD